MNLYHYYDKTIGPFKSLSDIDDEEANRIIPIEEFDLKSISFTYGDSHPTFSERVQDGKEYRKKLYTYEEILKIIDKYGLPQVWNPDGRYGPERYVEAHIWTDDVIKRYL